MSNEIEDDNDDISLDESDDMCNEFDDTTDFRLLVEGNVADICNTYVSFGELNINSLLQFELRPIVFLTEEEREVINKCVDDKLTRLLILNRAQVSQVRELMKQLQSILAQCNKCIAKGKQSIEDFKTTRRESKNMIKSAIWKMAAPYFKDSQFYGAPPNADVIKKQNNGELCLLEVNEGRKWCNSDKSALMKNIKLQYYNYCHKELQKTLKIKTCQARNTVDDEKAELEWEINNLNIEIDALKPVYPPLGAINGIDWLNISGEALKGKHPVIECIAFWNMILHPALNTNEWSAAEEQKLKELAKDNQYQDWDTIVSELGTNRSSFSAAKHYLSNFANKFKKERFTSAEDEYLLEVINNVRLGSYIPWGKVAYYFDNRSKFQLYHRYTYYLSYNHVKKGTFTEAEDALLIFLVKKFGRNFKKVCKYFTNRSPIQLRNRFNNYFEKDSLEVGIYSYDDDYKIIEHFKRHGDKNWRKVSSVLQRSRAHVRQRHLTLRKWIAKNPGRKLTDMPRRNRASITKHYTIRNQHISAILKRISSEGDIPTLKALEDITLSTSGKTTAKNKKKFIDTNKRTYFGVDKDIIHFFKGTCKFQKEHVSLNENMHMESAHRIIQLMDLLNENMECFRHADEDNDFLNLKTSTTLTYIKNILENTIAETKFLQCSGKDSEPGPSNIDTLVHERKSIKSFLPPTIRTLLGLRGLIIKFNMYKNQYKIDNDSTKHLSDTLSQKLQQSLVQCNSSSRSTLEYERNLFAKRLYAVFKWPIILSNQFPTHVFNCMSALDSEGSLNNKSILGTKQLQSTQVTLKINLGDDETARTKKVHAGRPRKVLSAKVIKMNNARLAKMLSHAKTPNNNLTEKEVHETPRPSKIFIAKVIPTEKLVELK